MRENMIVYVPTSSRASEGVVTQGVPMAVSGERVAILNNRWGAMDQLAALLEVELMERYAAANVRQFSLREPIPGQETQEDKRFELDDAFYDKVAEWATLAITGLGN